MGLYDYIEACQPQRKPTKDALPQAVASRMLPAKYVSFAAN